MGEAKFCTKCGRGLRPGSLFCPACGRQIDEQPDAPAGHSAEQASVKPLEQEQPAPSEKRTRLSGWQFWLIIGSITVVLACGVGAAVAFLVMDQRSGKTLTQADASKDAVTITTSAPSIQTTTTSVSTDNSAYRDLLNGTAQALAAYDARIAKPNLASTINSTLPDVPTSVDDELQAMLDDLKTRATTLQGETAPAGYGDALNWLSQALNDMQARVSATLAGVQTARSAGDATAGNSEFAQGRDYRDAYAADMEKFKASMSQLGAANLQ